MIALDTSVLVAAFASWHEAHGAVRKVMGRRPWIPAHVLIETYSVLTRLPAPHRANPQIVADFLDQFAERVLVLPPHSHSELIHQLPQLGVSGGAIYDALVGATAREADAVLMTRDRRATLVYDALGVRHDFVSVT